MKKHILSMLCVLLCVLHVSATEHITWEEKQYYYLHGDFNGDNVPDLLLQSLSEQNSSLIVFGQVIDENTQYLVENEIKLPDIIDGHLWNNEQANIAIFDHNHDGLSDIFIVIHSQKIALVINGDVDNIDFSNIAHAYSKKEFKWLKKSKKYALYVGDFNGDKQHDLLAVSEKNNTHYLMHSNENNSLSVVQEVKKSFKWAKKSDVEVKVADFNNDGKTDVFAVARAKNTKHYSTYADENGLLGETTTVKEKVNNKDWNANDFSLVVSYADDDDNLDLVRLNNMPGGIDENGEFIEAELDEDVDDVTNDCDQLFYSIETQGEGVTCAPWDSQNENGLQINEKDNQINLTSLAKGNNLATVLPCDTGGGSFFTQSINAIPGGGGGENPCLPNTPSSYPVVSGGSYHPIGSSIAISIPPVTNATYYEVHYSHSGSLYSKLFSTTTLSGSATIRSSYGYFYLKYKACNYEGCSALSSYRRLYAYTAPGTPSYLKSSNYSPTVGDGYDLTFSSAGGSVTGTVYTVKQSINGGSYSTFCTRTRASWQETSYSCSVSGEYNAGTYKYQVQACNPRNVGCGGVIYSSNIVVSDPAATPVLDSIDNKTINENTSFSYAANATDANGDAISYSLTVGPSWLNIDS
jgi:hypothetical protein